MDRVTGRCNWKVVPGTGIEPVQLLSREILSLLCLPISPPGRRGQLSGRNNIMQRCWLHRFRRVLGREVVSGAVGGDSARAARQELDQPGVIST
jgi:hypothetical protein